MRRDYTLGEGEYYSNFAQIRGEVTLDLGGYTLSQYSSVGAKPLFGIVSKPWGNTGMEDGRKDVFPTTINIENGTVLTYNSAIFKLGMNSSTGSPESLSDKLFVINASGVTFGFKDGVTATSLLFAYNGGKSTSSSAHGKDIVPFEFNFVDCVFDLSTSKPSGNTLLFDIDSSSNYIKNTVTVIGGEIRVGMPESTVISNTGAGGSALLFDKAEGGYTTVTVPAGTAFDALAGRFITKDGVECEFRKSTDNGDTVTYQLYPKVMDEYRIYTSVTLYSSFVYNVYIPTAGVNSFTVNGSAYEYTTEIIDGTECYVVRVALPVGEPLSDIVVSVKLNSGDSTVSASWTLNVYTYAKSVLGGDYDDTTKALMKDMLVYAAAAHTYFGSTETVSEKLSGISALLGDYTAPLPAGEAKKPEGNTFFTDVAVYLGGTPSFRFYLASGYTADDFTFTVGGRAVTATAGNGYVEITMYAYMMLDDVAFTNTTTGESGTYNLYSYYEYAKTLNDANLIAIVEGLMKYSASAAEYRRSVTVAGN